MEERQRQDLDHMTIARALFRPIDTGEAHRPRASVDGDVAEEGRRATAAEARRHMSWPSFRQGSGIGKPD